jgi:hypothetical protein
VSAARADAGPQPDAAPDGTDELPDLCRGLDARTAPLVREVVNGAPPPRLAGGALVPGRYHLVAATRHATDAGVVTEGDGLRLRVLLEPGAFGFASLEERGAPNCGTFALEASGAHLTMRLDGALAWEVDYEATPDGLRLLDVTGLVSDLARD